MLENIIKYGLPLLSIGISLVTFYFSTWSQRAKLKVELTGKTREMKPDRPNYEEPDSYIFEEYRLFVDIQLINKSSAPLTITEFKIKGAGSIRYSDQTGTFYKVTLKNTNPTLLGDSIVISYDFNKVPKILPPIILAPYSVNSGTLIFKYKEPLPKNVVLEVVSSRRKFKKKIEVSLRSYSVLQTNLEIPEVDESFLDL